MRFRCSIIVLFLTACASATEAPSKAVPLRVGHTFSNGNCALDAEGKLTGLCMASNSAGTSCTTHAPAPDSPPCTPGIVIKETRAPACNAGNSQEVLSREHQCFFVDR